MKLEEYENEGKQNNQVNKILSKSISVIFCLVVFLLVKGCVHASFSNIKTNKYSQKDSQLVKDAGFIKGFEIVNTSVLEEFCSVSGYVPKNFIDKFKEQFNNTILNANEILEKYGVTEETLKSVTEEINEQEVLEKDFNDLSQHGISKKEYCQMFDELSDTILSEKSQQLKQYKPYMYKD